MKHWPLHQLDINNAFLHKFLHEEAYSKPPQDYSKVQKGQVCRLKRSLYGLTHASREWNSKFTSQLIKFNFQQFENDHCLFVYKSTYAFLILLVYVDDVLITGNSESHILKIKDFLHSTFII